MLATLLATGFLLAGCYGEQTSAGPAAVSGACIACHVQRDGNPPLGPQLAGLDADYIAEQLRNYRQQLRGIGYGAGMVTISSRMSDEDIAASAAWFAALEPDYPRPQPPVAAADRHAGERIYADRCAGCHDSMFGRFFTGSPSIEFLDARYIGRQLRWFAEGRRQSVAPDKHKRKMQVAAEALSAEERAQLSAYLASRSGG